MGAEVYGLEETIMRVERFGDRLPKRSLDVMRHYERQMIQAARDYAPFKDGYLENSIRHLEEDIGVRGRKSLVWGVDTSMLGPGYQKYGFRYDVAMEEGHFTNLGEGSIAKGPDVGEAYIARAVWDYEDELREALEDLARAQSR